MTFLSQLIDKQRKRSWSSTNFDEAIPDRLSSPPMSVQAPVEGGTPDLVSGKKINASTKPKVKSQITGDGEGKAIVPEMADDGASNTAATTECEPSEPPAKNKRKTHAKPRAKLQGEIMSGGQAIPEDAVGKGETSAGATAICETSEPPPKKKRKAPSKPRAKPQKKSKDGVQTTLEKEAAEDEAIVSSSKKAPPKPKAKSRKKANGSSDETPDETSDDEIIENVEEMPKKAPAVRARQTAAPDLRGKLNTVVTLSTCGPRFDDDTRGVKRMRKHVLHVDMLRVKSPYLYEQIQKRGGEEMMRWTLGLDSDAFNVFASWVYGGKIEFDLGPELLEDHSGFDPGDILQSVLETSLLGVQLKAETFCHAVIDRACQISRQEGLLFRVANINTIYAQTERSSSIRKWIVDEWVWQYDARTKDDDMSWEDHKHLSPEVLFDVSREQGKRLGWRAQAHSEPAKKGKKYHERIAG